jgi:hypothetical protein
MRQKAVECKPGAKGQPNARDESNTLQNASAVIAVFQQVCYKYDCLVCLALAPEPPEAPGRSPRATYVCDSAHHYPS